MELKEVEELENGVTLEVEVKRRRKKRKRKGRKRTRKREKMTGEEEEIVLQDPLEILCRDQMLMILKNFDARSVALTLLVSRAWHSGASSDSLWNSKLVPDYWRNLDPYWRRTSPLMRRYFHIDGSQTADPGDKVCGGHECCYSIVTSFVGEGKIREHYVRINRWPHMVVSRKQDWSSEMSNSFYCYCSVPDAHLEGGTGPCLQLFSASHVKVS